jgi:quercetin dioxygenase-like cupin family protein
MTTLQEPKMGYSGRDEGEAIWHLGALVTIRLDGTDTGGALALVETIAPRGMGSPPHVHTREDETFIVLEGEVAFSFDGRETAARAGTAVHLPRGVPHWFTVVSERARFLSVISPAGFEDFFRALSEPAARRELPPALDGPPDIEPIRQVAARFGCEILV